jgi:hypothetical protein
VNEEVNFVLAGYFSKIFIHLLTHKGDLIIPYLFNGQDRKYMGLLKHLTSKSIIDCVNRLLLYCCNTGETQANKIFIIKELIITLSITSDIETAGYISDLFIDLLNNDDFYKLFKSDFNLFVQIYSLIKARVNNSEITSHVLKILIKVNESLIKELCSNQAPSTSEEDHTITQQIINENNLVPKQLNCNLDGIVNILSESLNVVIAEYVKPKEYISIDTTYGETKVILGQDR